MNEVNELESKADEERKEYEERWKESRETLDYLLSEISLDEKTARFAVSRFPKKWILQAVIQAKAGDRPKGLFCWYMANPEKVIVPSEKNPKGRGLKQSQDELSLITEPPATKAEVSTAVDSIIASLGSTQKRLKNGSEIIKEEEERRRNYDRRR